jgi:hypothetical protein
MNGVRNEGTVGVPGQPGNVDAELPRTPTKPSSTSTPSTNGDGFDAGAGNSTEGWEATRILQATVAGGGTVTIANLALYGASLRGGGLDGPFDPVALRASLHETLDRVLPPGTPPEVAAKLKADLDALLDKAATAKPIRLPSGEVLTPAEALKGLQRALTMAAAAMARAPQGSVTPPPPPPPPPEPAKVTTNPALPPAQAPKPAPPKQPSASEQAAAYGQPSQRKVNEGHINAAVHHDDDAAARISKNKRALAAMTPQEKAAAIRQLMDGWTKDPEDRAILDILLSCSSREEFDEVMRLAGGGNVWKELDHRDSEEKMVLLFQMWGRTDLIPVKWREWAASQVPEGILLQPDAGDLEALGSDPADVDPAYGRTGADMNSKQSASLDKHLYREMDPGARAQLIMENARRKAAGLPPLDLNKVTAQARAIIEDPTLTQGQKDARIEALRKEHGLTGDVMRELVTGRMARALGEVKTDLETVYRDNLQALMMELVKLGYRDEEIGENDPPEVKKLKQKIKELKNDAESRLGALQAQSDALNALYKVPAGFWSDFCDLMADVGKIALKVLDVAAPLLNFIPGVGNALYLAYVAAKTIMAAVNGDMMGVLAGVASLAGPLGGAVGGSVGSLVVKGGQLIKSGMAIAQGADALSRGDIVGAIAGFGAGAAGAAGALGASARTINTINETVKVGSGLAVTAEGIANGDWEKALGGLLTAANGRIPMDKLNKLLEQNPWIKDTFEHTKRGVEFFKQVKNGDYLAALGTLDKELTGWAAGTSAEAFLKEARRLPVEKLEKFLDEHPEVRDLARHGQKGVQLYNQIKNGDYEGALQTLGELPGGDKLKEVVDKVKTLGAAQVEKFLDENPAVKEALKHRKEGVQLFNQLRSGDYAGALATLQKVLPDVLGDDFKKFLDRHPEIQDLAKHGPKAVQLYQQIRAGDYAAALSTLQELPGGEKLKDIIDRAKKLSAESIEKFLNDNPTIKRALAQKEEGIKLFNQLRSRDYEGALATLQKVLPEVLAGSDIEKLMEDAKRRLDSPEIRAVYQRFEQAAPFVAAVATGDYGAALTRLLEVEELEPIHEEIKQARAAVRKFGPTIREMVNESLRELQKVQAGGQQRAAEA